MIPSEWKTMRIDTLFNVRAGGDFEPARSSSVRSATYPYPIYSNGLSKRGLHGFCNYNEAPAGSITITARGVLGKAFFRGESFSAIGRLLILEPKVTVDARFFAEYINCNVYFSIESTGVPQLTVPQAASYFLSVPPLWEQQAIAGVLSDVDALIESLQALIVKKQNIKKAAMQQLLTGRIRLPGFKGEWQQKQLGDVADIKTGDRNNQDKSDDGPYPFFVRSDVVERIDTYSHDGEAIVVPGEGGIGNIFHYIDGRFDFHQRCYKISNFITSVCGKFMYYMMVQNFGSHALKNTVKATVDSLRLPTFKKFSFSAPPSNQEQQAIARVLSDMDAEIEALEQRLSKTRALKKGMMQQLLTGKIRLPKQRKNEPLK